MSDENDSDAERASPISSEADTFPVECSNLRENGFVMLMNRPCKIQDIKVSDAGICLHGIDLFYPKLHLEQTFPLDAIVQVPNVRRSEYQIADIDVDTGCLTLVGYLGEMREDLKVPPGELGADLREEHDAGKSLICIVARVGDEEAVISFKQGYPN